jgi:hypothetical protein
MDFAAIIGRLQRLLLSPGAEWDAIAGEPADIQKIYMNYVGPLVIASALAAAIGLSVFGENYGFITYRPSAGAALTQAILSVVLTLVGVYVLGFVINALAPQFGGTQDAGQAFKLAAYSGSAAWVAGLLAIIPQLKIIVVLASFYSLYLLYVGLPKLMKPAEDKALVYTLAIIGVMVVLGVVIAVLAASMMPSVTPMMRVN